MVIPGMYFLVKCTNEICPYFSKILPSYIGSNGKFDIFHSFKLLKCGGCFLKIQSIVSILFASCVWGYRGLVKNEKKVTTETDKKVFKVEIFDHKKVATWDWLVITVKPLQQQIFLENLEFTENDQNCSKLIEDMIMQFASSIQTSKYYKKHELITDLLDFPVKRIYEAS
jgi:hypothetical protein